MGKKTNQEKQLFWGLTAFALLNIFSTYMNRGELVVALLAFIKLYAMFFFVVVMLVKKRINLRVLSFPVEVLLLINLACRVIYPHGMYTMIGSNGSFYSNQVWILGGKNSYYYYLAWLLMIYVLEDSQHKGNTNILFVKIYRFLLILINVIIVSGSVTSIIGSLMIMTYQEMSDKGVFKNKRNVILFAGISLLLFFNIVINANRSRLLEMVSQYTGKSTNMTNRTIIWERTLLAIKDKVWLGYGFEYFGDTVIRIGQTTSHNKYLWILYRGGVFSGVLFLGVIIYAIIQLYNNYNQYAYVRKCMWILFVTSIMWLVEVYDNNCLIFAMILICCFIKNLQKNVYKEQAYK